MVRIALVGQPGAGKSTTAQIFKQLLNDIGHEVVVVKIASPLYDIQNHFYDRMDTSLLPDQQDGVFLNFLGSHFRSVSPGFLLCDFKKRWMWAVLTGAQTIVCDDARPTDIEGLKNQGFVVIHILASDTLRRRRKTNRGDKTSGSDNHPTELGYETLFSHYRIENSGDLAELTKQIRIIIGMLVNRVIPDHEWPVDDCYSESEALKSFVQQAVSTISRRYVENHHQIGAAILTGDGRVFTGLHVEAMVGRASVCAEAVALGKACEFGATDLRLIAAVRHPKPSEKERSIELVSPCGLCREILLDYSDRLQVVVGGNDNYTLVPLSEMLPMKYVGTKWRNL